MYSTMPYDILGGNYEDDIVDRAKKNAEKKSQKTGKPVDVIGELEAAIGKPAICSNQAMIWDTLRLAGINDRLDGFGRLLSAH